MQRPERDNDQNTPPRRSGRQVRPPTTYTPSRPDNTVQKTYTINRRKLENKAKEACERDRIKTEVNKCGNLVITFNAGAYSYYHHILDNLYEESQGQNAAALPHIERTTGTDTTGVKICATYKIKGTQREGCVINCYHTTCRALVNGKVTYYRREINPLIVGRMDITEISQRNLDILNGITNNPQGGPATQQMQSITQQRHHRRQGQPTSQQGQPENQHGQPTSRQGQPTSPQGQTISYHGQPTRRQGHPTSHQGQPTNHEQESQQGYTMSHGREPTSQQGQPEIQQRQPKSRQGQPTSHQGQPTSHQGQPTSQQGQPTSQQGQPTSQQGQPTSQRGQPTSQQGQPTS